MLNWYERQNLQRAAAAVKAERAARALARGVSLDELARLEAEEEAKARAEFIEAHGYDPEAAMQDAIIDQHHEEQVTAMADILEAAILKHLDGASWRRSLPVIADACAEATHRFLAEMAATPPD
jgi:hypothetical protein